MAKRYIAGSLFTHDYLNDAITDTAEYSDVDVDGLVRLLGEVFRRFPGTKTPSEAQTEDDLIWPVLSALGWDSYERQVNLAPKGRDNVPDGLLFLDERSKSTANRHSEQWKKYQHGAVVVESKGWRYPLDRGSRRRRNLNAPSTQMVRYLRRVDDLTDGRLRWGFLTNGAVWRLYYQGASSVSEQFLEVDLASMLQADDDPPVSDGPEDRTGDPDHCLRIFAAMFGRGSFLQTGAGPRTFHLRALEEGRFHEERVTQSLSDIVFDKVFPILVMALASDQPQAELEDVRQAALVTLYRLLFLLYAEDRNLLPTGDERYANYALRNNVREDIRKRKDRNDTFSDRQARYWSIISALCHAIGEGDPSIGLPPYNGSLFDRDETPLLLEASVPDDTMAQVVDLLSFEQRDGRRRYINYRDLSVQHLGSIYERLMELEITCDRDENILIRPNPFARKASGSYYTPEELVALILERTLKPLIDDRLATFRDRADKLADTDFDEDRKIRDLRTLDPAEALLSLRICDPAMGSGHFLVGTVDYLADTVIEMLAEATNIVYWAEEPYTSPLSEQIDSIRGLIEKNARDNEWTVDFEQLQDRHIVRRMVLKRCVYGVDKNPMAVELAKVSLWLHTLTAGAPLSFLDHHLRCGDSLFGATVQRALKRMNDSGQELLVRDAIADAYKSAASMTAVERLTDVEIAEARHSARIFSGVVSETRPLDRFLTLLHAVDWLNLSGREDRSAVKAWLDGLFGNPVEVARYELKPPWLKADEKPDAPDEAVAAEHGTSPPTKATDKDMERFKTILDKTRTLTDEERFFNWELAFPGVWEDWEKNRTGGFDAIVSNPPWHRIKLKETEWFSLRDRGIAMATRAADRKKMINSLQRRKDPLYDDYITAKNRASDSARMARSVGDYPCFSRGDINLYSLFVERSMALVKEGGMVGLLTPSGVASDKTASTFFKALSTEGHLRSLFDFENRRPRHSLPPFFPDVDSRFKFLAFIASPTRSFPETHCGFFLQSADEVHDTSRCFPLTAEDFSRVNPNTGTAPVFQSRRDADLTMAIYRRTPVLVDRTGKEPSSVWPVAYECMFHMTNDSDKFRTRKELEQKEGAWQVGGNLWESEKEKWVPLYEGKMIQAYDHRAASIVVNPANRHRPAQPVDATIEQSADPDWAPTPEYWVNARKTSWDSGQGWTVGFKEITAATNARTLIAAALPAYGFGNKVPVWKVSGRPGPLALFLANLNSIPLDFVCRQKVHGQTLNLFIIEQLPIIPQRGYQRRFGSKTAAEVIQSAVLELTYTAHDMVPFAHDLGYVDGKGKVKPPFPWERERRLRLKAKIDAVFFFLYGIFDPKSRRRSIDNVRYIYSTFPVLERSENSTYESYRSRDLALAYCNALAAGRPDAEPET